MRTVSSSVGAILNVVTWVTQVTAKSQVKGLDSDERVSLVMRAVQLSINHKLQYGLLSCSWVSGDDDHVLKVGEN